MRVYKAGRTALLALAAGVVVIWSSAHWQQARSSSSVSNLVAQVCLRVQLVELADYYSVLGLFLRPRRLDETPSWIQDHHSIWHIHKNTEVFWQSFCLIDSLVWQLWVFEFLSSFMLYFGPKGLNSIISKPNLGLF